MEPPPLWTPSEARQAGSRLRHFLDRLAIGTYDEAWEWSVGPDSIRDFWAEVAAEFGVVWAQEPTAVLVDDPSKVPGVRWFPDGRLNYAARALTAPSGDSGRLAVRACSNSRADIDLTWSDLSALVGRVRAGLHAAGVGAGDRVVAYLPNVPETLAAMLATASLGAIWSCCAPEMGVSGVLDRLSQITPTVLIAVDGYRYGDRVIDRADEAVAIRRGLPTVTGAVWLSYLDPGREPPADWISWDRFSGEDAPMDFAPVPFDHPLYVLFSSGTTGKPKPIVHGHGGILLEHAKAIGLHFDVGPGDRLFWYTTTGWMMWNFCVSGLLTGATVVMFDGNPVWPRPDSLWEVMASTGTTCGGVGAGFLVSAMKAGDRPGTRHDLTALRTLGATGSPLPAPAASWVYEEVAADMMLASFSGGTDVCTGFVGPSPLHPVWAGEISCRSLGAKVEVFDDGGRPLVGAEGELVLTAPLPSMPVGFWGDDGSRYRAAYFERFPGVWAHGDRATITERGSVIISGRSDGTLNRGGVRMGTAEFYNVVEGIGDVTDSLVVHLEDGAGGPGELWLFVVPSAGPDAPMDGDGGLGQRIKEALRRDLSPRHVPDRVVAVAAIPRTLSGKKLEVPVKRILLGTPVEDALMLASVANPESLAPFVEFGRAGQRAEES